MKKCPPRFIWSKVNTLIFVVAVVIITLAYIIMRKGDITISPVLLTLAYVVLIPLSLILTPRNANPQEEEK